MTDATPAPHFEVSLGPKAKVARVGGFTGTRSIYPWESLLEPVNQPNPETGEEETLYYQFFVEGTTTKAFSGKAQNAGKRLNRTFVVRQAKEEVPEGSGKFVDGVLVQRVEYREPKKMQKKEPTATA
jgi:hypothetical protein